MSTHRAARRQWRSVGDKLGPEQSGILFHWGQGAFRPLGTRTMEMKVPMPAAIGGASLGLRLHDAGSVIHLLKQGLAYASFEHLCSEIEIPTARLAEVTSISPRTLARRKREGRLQLGESERVFRLSALFDKASQALGSADTARQWFKTPKKALAGKSPLEYADTEVGAREVEDLLGRLEHGVFS